MLYGRLQSLWKVPHNENGVAYEGAARSSSLCQSRRLARGTCVQAGVNVPYKAQPRARTASWNSKSDRDGELVCPWAPNSTGNLLHILPRTLSRVISYTTLVLARLCKLHVMLVHKVQAA